MITETQLEEHIEVDKYHKNLKNPDLRRLPELPKFQNLKNWKTTTWSTATPSGPSPTTNYNHA